MVLAGLTAAALSALTNPVCSDSNDPTCNQFDTSGNSMLAGTYYVREIQIAGIDSLGTSLNNAYTLWGTMTFSVDSTTGNGTYTLTAQKLDSSVTTGAAAVTCPTSAVPTCGFAVGSNGLMVLQDPLFPSSVLLGAVGAAGPHAFVLTRPSSSSNNTAILVGIPVGGTSLSGDYYASYFNLHGASLGTVRQAWLSFTADGNGGMGTPSLRAIGNDLGNTTQTGQLTGTSYSFSGNAGTMNLGSSSPFIGGTQAFYISSDGSIIVGGSTTDFDILLGIKALGGTASNGSFQGVYVIGGFENDSSVGGRNTVKTFSGSTSATGTGTSITHQEALLSSNTSVPYFKDYTSQATYAVPDSGVFTPTDNHQYALGANGTFLGTGAFELESVVLGLKTPAYSGSGVWLNPIGVVNAANSAPFTNPVAPNEIVTLYGDNLAPDTVPAPAGVFPLPKILDGVRVYVNGAPAPLLYVSSAVIEVLTPSSWYPNNGWGYLTFQVFNNGTYSNAVRVFAQNAAPGIFNLTGSAVGPAAVRHALDNTLVTADNPAHPGDIVSIYGTGLGIVGDQPDDGDTVSDADPLVAAWSVSIGGVQCTPQPSNYAGLAPGYSGLYQINVTVPSGTGFGDVPIRVSVRPGVPNPSEAQTVETTINVQP